MLVCRFYSVIGHGRRAPLFVFKVPMKRNFLFFHMKEHKKLERLPFTDP